MFEDLQSFLEASQAELENNFNKLSKQMEDAATGGQGWDWVNKMMDLSESIADKSLTKTNQLYETNKLLRQVNQDIDKTTNEAAKRKLKAYANEITSLQQVNKLSKNALEIAKAQYEVLKAQIALEDARNAKSTVRLQRDSEGNYGYVYTADQNKIAEAEQAVADTQNALYNRPYYMSVP